MASPGDAERRTAAPDAESRVRLDKWLWFARVAKTRTLAGRLVIEGKIRVNRVRISKPAHGVKSGDVVTARVGRIVRVLKVTAAGERRGPPSVSRPSRCESPRKTSGSFFRLAVAMMRMCVA